MIETINNIKEILIFILNLFKNISFSLPYISATGRAILFVGFAGILVYSLLKNWKLFIALTIAVLVASYFGVV